MRALQRPKRTAFSYDECWYTTSRHMLIEYCYGSMRLRSFFATTMALAIINIHGSLFSFGVCDFTALESPGSIHGGWGTPLLPPQHNCRNLQTFNPPLNDYTFILSQKYGSRRRDLVFREGSTIRSKVSPSRWRRFLRSPNGETRHVRKGGPQTIRSKQLTRVSPLSSCI